jgi:hypothetical protein
MSKRESTLTQERLKEILHYNPKTGVFTWRVDKGWRAKAGNVAGSTMPDGYRAIRIDFIRYESHRLAWLYVHGVWPSGEIDHKHGKEAGDGIDNLRDVTTLVNRQNERAPRPHNKSGFLGVHWDKEKKKWHAAIRVGGKKKHLGRFETAEEASAAYLAAKRKYHPGCTI